MTAHHKYVAMLSGITVVCWGTALITALCAL